MTPCAGETNSLEWLTAVGESPVVEVAHRVAGILSTTRHVKPCGKQGGPPSKAKYQE